MTPHADTPSEEERALWEKADLIRRRYPKWDKDVPGTFKVEGWEGDAAAFLDALTPSVILSLLTALASEREAGERDKARLDFMQESAANARAVMDMDPEAEVGYRVSTYNGDEGEGATLRDAIDAAFIASTRHEDAPDAV